MRDGMIITPVNNKCLIDSTYHLRLNDRHRLHYAHPRLQLVSASLAKKGSVTTRCCVVTDQIHDRVLLNLVSGRLQCDYHH